MEKCNYSKCKWPYKVIDLRDPGQFRKLYKGKKYHDNCLIKLRNQTDGPGWNK